MNDDHNINQILEAVNQILINKKKPEKKIEKIDLPLDTKSIIEQAEGYLKKIS